MGMSHIDYARTYMGLSYGLAEHVHLYIIKLRHSETYTGIPKEKEISAKGASVSFYELCFNI